MKVSAFMAWFGKNYDNFVPFVASGTVTLTAGAASVTDTNITANSLIRLYLVTAGGTVGAPFVASKTAATGFGVQSSSNTDTSTLRYEIVSY